MTNIRIRRTPVLDSKRIPATPFISTFILLVTFAAIFIGMGFYLDSVRSSVSRKQFSTQKFGPLYITRPLEAVTIRLFHLPPPNSWTYLETIVSEKNGKVMFSFGDEFYHESSDPPFFKNTSAIKIFLPGKHTYELDFYVESAKVADCGKDVKHAPAIIDVAVDFHRGDSYWHYLIGLVLLAAGAILFFSWKFFPLYGLRFRNITAAILITGFTALTSASLMGLNLETDPGPAWGTVKNDREIMEDPSLREGSLGGPDHLGGSLMGGK